MPLSGVVFFLLADTLGNPGRYLHILTLSEFKYNVCLHPLKQLPSEAIFVCLRTRNLRFSTRFVGDFKMVNIVSYWLVDSVDYFKAESRKVRLF